MRFDPRAVRWVRFAAGLAVLAALGVAYLFSEGFRGEVDLALGILGSGEVARIRDYILSFGAWAPAVSALLMVLQALAAPLPAFLLTFANGLAFGVFWGGMLSLTSASLAAAASFSIARFLGRWPAEAIVGRSQLGAADRWFLRWGAYAVLVARLVPVVSFDVVSYAAGLTSMGFWRFMVATVVGMAPATFAYSYFGERAPQYVTVLVVVFGAMIAVVLVAGLLRLRGQGRRIPLVEEKEDIEKAEVEFDDQTAR